jgi:putative transposase
MRCIGCGSEAVTERPERTAQGYRRFRCRTCGKQFNERTGGLLNRTQYPSDVIALVVLWRLRYKLALRDLPEMFLVRGLVFSHEAVREWEAKLTPALAEDLRRRRRGKAGRSWYVDETYIKVQGRWCYLYRAIDRSGALVDVMFSEHRDMAAAKAFFRSAKAVTGVMPDRVTTDGHDSYPRSIRTGLGRGVWHRTSRYLNNRLEIGQSQMTKADLLARPVRRHHVANLDLPIGDDHSVNQELDQGSPLLEGGLVQALPHPPAELPDGVGQPRKLLLPVRLCFELPRLLLKLLLASFEVTPAPPVFVELHHAGEIGVRQTLELLFQTIPPQAQPLPARLQLLR